MLSSAILNENEIRFFFLAATLVLRTIATKRGAHDLFLSVNRQKRLWVALQAEIMLPSYNARIKYSSGRKIIPQRTNEKVFRLIRCVLKLTVCCH